jgi:F-type H+-transporting ATPase subunit a
MSSAIDHTLWITLKVNEVLGPPVAGALEWLKQHGIALPYNPDLPIPDNLVVTWVLMILVGGLAFWSGRRLQDTPRGFQHIWELFGKVILTLLDDLIGREKGRKFFSMIGTLAIFILLANFSGLIPMLKAPTSSLNTTLGCAIVAFFYYHHHGIKQQGLVPYLKHFGGPNPIVAPIMVPIETISHLSRVMSLSIRLFGNIMGEDVVIIILFLLYQWVVPLPMMAFSIFGGILQTFIFCMLTMMYLAGAVAEEH